MRALLRRHSALLTLVFRAAMVFVPFRLILVAMEGAADSGPVLENPVGIVLLVMLLGLVDTRVRGDRMLWANLGYGHYHVLAIFGLVGMVLETIWHIAPLLAGFSSGVPR